MEQDQISGKPLSDRNFSKTRPGGKEGRISSQELLRGCSELVIEHNGREYRLRLTQSGKLILTA
jgi:hemin uptake protein HemP